MVSIDLETRCARGKDKQCTYSSVDEYIAKNSPPEGKLCIYYIASATGSGKNLDIHWNAVIVDPKKGYVLIYDPSGTGYNFDNDKKMSFCMAITKIKKLHIVQSDYDQPQQLVCNSMFAGVDIFCQSWVVLFASFYITDQLDGLARIDFAKYQALPLKMWISCMVKRYHKILSVEDYGIDLSHFFRYVILQGDYYKDYIIANMPDILSCGEKMPVSYSIVKNFADPKSDDEHSIVKMRPSLV